MHFDGLFVARMSLLPPPSQDSRACLLRKPACLLAHTQKVTWVYGRFAYDANKSTVRRAPRFSYCSQPPPRTDSSKTRVSGLAYRSIVTLPNARTAFEIQDTPRASRTLYRVYIVHADDERACRDETFNRDRCNVPNCRLTRSISSTMNK